MGFCLSVTGPCRDCMDAEILVRRSRNWIGDSISVPVYKVWCKHENADRIRSMTDEELADWLGVYCNGQTAQEVGKPCASGMGSCEECWLDWLRQEADG